MTPAPVDAPQREPAEPLLALHGPAGRARAREEDVLLPVGGSHLWVVLHHPACGEPQGGVIVCSPFGPEKVKAHRTLVALARTLAARGLAVARFDHRGEGDAGGDFADFDFQDRLDDVDAVTALLGERFGIDRPAGVGLRLGATILAEAMARRRELRAPAGPDAAAGAPGRDGHAPPPLVLWAPLISPAGYLRDMLRANVLEQGMRHGRVLRDRESLLAGLAGGETVVVDGFPLRWRLFEQAEQLELGRALDRLGPPPVPVMLVDIARGVQRRPVAAELAALAERTGAVARSVPSRSCFWQDFRFHRPQEPELFASTCSFLEEWLSGHA